MRVRITLRVAPRDRDGTRLSAEQLRHEAARIVEELSVAEERGAIQDVWTETDAEDSSITAEAIVPFDDPDIAVAEFTSLVVAATEAAGERPPQLPWPVHYDIRDSRAQPSGLDQDD